MCQVLVLDANGTLPQVIKEFQNHEPEIFNKIAVKQGSDDVSSTASDSSPSKKKDLLFSDQSQHNIIINGTGL